MHSALCMGSTRSAGRPAPRRGSRGTRGQYDATAAAAGSAKRVRVWAPEVLRNAAGARQKPCGTPVSIHPVEYHPINICVGCGGVGMGGNGDGMTGDRKEAGIMRVGWEGVERLERVRSGQVLG